jgi:hypothetical protein
MPETHALTLLVVLCVYSLILYSVANTYGDCVNVVLVLSDTITTCKFLLSQLYVHGGSQLPLKFK